MQLVAVPSREYVRPVHEVAQLLAGDIFPALHLVQLPFVALHAEQLVLHALHCEAPASA